MNEQSRARLGRVARAEVVEDALRAAVPVGAGPIPTPKVSWPALRGRDTKGRAVEVDLHATTQTVAVRVEGLGHYHVRLGELVGAVIDAADLARGGGAQC